MTKRITRFFSGGDQDQDGGDHSHHRHQPSTSAQLMPNFYSSASYSKATFDARSSKSSGNIQRLPPQLPAPSGSGSSLSSPPSSASLYSSYDVISNRNEHVVDGASHGRTNWVMAAFLLINAALGAGLLNYPVAYDRLGGIVYATVIQVFAAVLLISTILVLVYCAQINNEDSYHGVMRTMCGRAVMQLSAASIAITCFGICVTFVIIIGDQFDRIFATYIGPDFCAYWWADRWFTMAATAIIFTWPMCYFRRLDFLRHVNVLGVMASFYIIFLNIYSYYYHIRESDQPPPIRTSPESLLEFIAALPVVFFAFQTHEIVIPVYDSMSEKNIKSFGKAIVTAMGALLILYCFAGSFGYLTFGSKVAPDIMLMYDARDPVVLAGIVALIVKMITTYPPVVFCGRDTIVRIVLSHYYQSYRGYQCMEESGQSSEDIMPHEQRCNIVITTLWNIMVLVLALVIPNITIAIGFLGSLASCNVFIFPGLALMALARRYARLRKIAPLLSANEELPEAERQPLTHNKWSPKRKWIQVAMQLYGLFIIGTGVLMFIIILIQVYHDFQQQTPHGAVCEVHKVLANGTKNGSARLLRLHLT